MSSRYPVGPIIGLGIAAAATWTSSHMTWARLSVADSLGGNRTVTLDGNQWAGAPTVLAVAFVAGIGAALAVSGWARRLVGVLVALIGGFASMPAVWVMSGHSSKDRAARLADLPAHAQVVSVEWVQAAGLVAFVGAAAAFVAGVILAKRPPQEAGLSERFNRPGTEDVEPSQRSMWAALDAGEDPTAGEIGHDGYAERNPDDAPLTPDDAVHTEKDS